MAPDPVEQLIGGGEEHALAVQMVPGEQATVAAGLDCDVELLVAMRAMRGLGPVEKFDHGSLLRRVISKPRRRPMANTQLDLSGPVHVISDSRERVAFDLMDRIKSADGEPETKGRAYYLELYKQCLAAVKGK